jgi:hypothetical protein
MKKRRLFVGFDTQFIVKKLPCEKTHQAQNGNCAKPENACRSSSGEIGHLAFFFSNLHRQTPFHSSISRKLKCGVF